VTNVESGASTTETIEWNMPNSAILELQTNGDESSYSSIQFLGQPSNEDLKFDFFFKGSRVQTKVYDPIQYKYKHHMAPEVKLDLTKSIISPMPGLVVSVAVEAG